MTGRQRGRQGSKKVGKPVAKKEIIKKDSIKNCKNSTNSTSSLIESSESEWSSPIKKKPTFVVAKQKIKNLPEKGKPVGVKRKSKALRKQRESSKPKAQFSRLKNDLVMEARM
jgi:hypothetical protein